MKTKFTDRYNIKNLDSEKTSQETLSKIKELSKKISIEPNPIHYSLIYELLIDQDDELVEEINTLIEDDNYDDNTAQIVFTNLWAKIIQRHLPYKEFSAILDHLLENINNWTESSNNNLSSLEKDIAKTEVLDDSQGTLKHIKSKILPHLKDSQENSTGLLSSVEKTSSEVNLLKKQLSQANLLARTDELTGLLNKRGFNENLKAMISQSKGDTNVSLVAFDIDYFKVINDEHGHLIGDSVLKYLAKTFNNETKGRDLIARTGGEEFILILKDTNKDNVFKLADSIRKKIDKSRLHIKRTDKYLDLSISVGISHYKKGETLDDFIHRADEALYFSKENGRNKVTMEDELPEK